MSAIKRQNFYTWGDQFYRDFMSECLRNLEPWFYPRNQILISELDEFGEIIFVGQGSIGFGFEINRIFQICITQIDNSIIGAYGLTFNQRSAYTYKTLTFCQGHFIRKFNWI